MIRGKIVIATVAALVMLTANGCAAASSPESPSAKNATASVSRFRITGYAESDGTTAAQLKASRAALTMVGIDGVNLTPDGSGITGVSASALSLLKRSHALHKSAELLIGNFSADEQDFSDALAQRMLNDPDHIASVVAALKAEVAAHGWDGITVDLEGLNGWGADGHTRDDNAGLVAFLTALDAAMGRHSISIAVVASTGSYADLGYDLKAVAKSVDHVVLMAYDQHGPTWSTAGPVGGYPWVKSSLKPLMRGVPRAKIQLGIAGYGYSWPADGSTGTQFTDASARAAVRKGHATPRWDATQKEWHAKLADGTVIWWSDAKSYRARLALARSLRLGGVAVWSLGTSDPLTD